MNVSELHQELNSRLLTLVRAEACRTPSLTIPSEVAALRADKIKQSFQRVPSERTGPSTSTSPNATFRSIQSKLTADTPVTVAQSLANIVSTQSLGKGMLSDSMSTAGLSNRGSPPISVASQKIETEGVEGQHVESSGSIQTPPLLPAEAESTHGRPNSRSWETCWTRQPRSQAQVTSDSESPRAPSSKQSGEIPV
uniref:Uncharacterized protein n=1 Tax=Noctiluca scintillans TaxID=2966 RepID=A0A7S1FDP9_NOCSC